MSDVGVIASPDREHRHAHGLVWVLLVVGVAGVASCVGFFIQGRRVAEQGRDYAHATILAIARPWDSRELLARADSTFLDVVPAEKLGKLIAFVSGRLGPLTQCDSVQNGDWRMSVGTHGAVVVTTHHAECSFENGRGRITLGLVRRGGAWHVQFINFDSDLLTEEHP